MLAQDVPAANMIWSDLLHVVNVGVPHAQIRAIKLMRVMMMMMMMIMMMMMMMMMMIDL